MTLSRGITADGVARHLARESFRDYAHAELLEAPVFERGVCFNPSCSARFAPTRDWHLYCCKECERQAMAEMRVWGHRLAFPSLVHRLTKYEREDEAIRQLGRAARRFISRTQSDWIADRQERVRCAGS